MKKNFEVFCSECGTKFEADSKMVHICPSCKEKKQEEKKVYAKKYAKNRAEKLGLVTIQIFKDDKKFIKDVAKELDLTVAEALKKIISSVNEK